MIVKISAIYIKYSKKSLRKKIDKGLFLENSGLEGDIKSGPGDKQVSFLRKEDRLIIDSDKREGLCFKRFCETLQLDSTSDEILVPGTVFQAGEALFEVTHAGKRCFPTCKIVRVNGDCALKNSGYLKVLKSGMVQVES